MARTLTLAQARRIAIAAQGLDRERPATVTTRHITDTLKRIGLLQIDSVNILARAHLLPLFARLGPFDPALLERATGTAPRRILETWAHEASYVPASTFPLLTWNRRRWSGMNPERLQSQHPGLFELILETITDHGPLTSRQVETLVEAQYTKRPDGGWGWSWSPAKVALEILFDAGKLTPAGRTVQFERAYDLTERVLPPQLRNQPVPDREEAIEQLVLIAASAHGVGTLRSLADYFRLPQRDTKAAIDALVQTDQLIPVRIDGSSRDAWLHPKARVPRKVQARALLAPFDPLVFERRRLLELFGMHYRLEIYTPAVKRIYGYYVLPFLLGEHLVGRVDLKHDRAQGVLLVRGAFTEPAQPQPTWPNPAEVARNLHEELQTMATWLGASGVVIEPEARGDLPAVLRTIRQFARITPVRSVDTPFHCQIPGAGASADHGAYRWAMPPARGRV